jgi:hypothetical protein
VSAGKRKEKRVKQCRKAVRGSEEFPFATQE